MEPNVPVTLKLIMVQKPGGSGGPPGWDSERKLTSSYT